MKKNVKAFLIAFCLSLLAIFAVAVPYMVSIQPVYAYSIPSNYGLSKSNIDNLNPGESYGGLVRDSAEKTYYIDGSNPTQSFITLARISHTNTLSGYTFKILVGNLVTLDITTDALNNPITEESFFGIGNSTYKFAGTLEIGGSDSTYLDIRNWTCLFNYISSEASIISNSGKYLIASNTSSFVFTNNLYANTSTMNISAYKHNVTSYTGSGNAGYFASYVDGTTPISLDLSTVFNASTSYSIESTTDNAGIVFGRIGSNADVTLTLPSIKGSATAQKGAGLLCGAIGGKLTIDSISASGNATSSSAGAGGIVGENELTGFFISTGTITYTRENASATQKVKGMYCGGLLGRSFGKIRVNNVNLSYTTIEGIGSDARIGGFLGHYYDCPEFTINGNVTVSNQTIKGMGYLGGFFGYIYLETANRGVTIQNAVLSNINIEADSAVYTGGYVSCILVKKGTNFVNILLGEGDHSFNFTGVASQSGGIVGFVKSNSNVGFDVVIDAPSMVNITNLFTLLVNSKKVGGVIGEINQALHVSMNNLNITNTFSQIADANIADGVGSIASKAIVTVGNITYKRNNNPSEFISSLNSGSIVRFTGALNDLSDAQDNIIYHLNNGLAYADTGFSITYPATVNGNDVGIYGQIFRNDNPNARFITFDDDTNTLSFDNASSIYNSSTNKITITSLKEFAMLAVYYNTVGGVNTINKPSFTYNEEIEITCDIDLRGTGIESLGRTNTAKEFAGSLDGNGNTITLAYGENVAGNNVNILNTNNNRAYFGLFPAIGAASFTDFT